MKQNRKTWCKTPTASALLCTAILLMPACSEQPMEERGEEALLELEQEIEEGAKDLEKAADEAAAILALENEQVLQEQDGLTETGDDTDGEPDASLNEEQEE